MEVNITIDESDAFRSFAAMVGQSPEQIMRDALQTAMVDFVGQHTGVITSYSVSVEDSDDDDSADTEDDGPDVPKGRSGLTDREVSRSIRSERPIIHRTPQSRSTDGMGPKGGPTGRTGRPATLHDMEASDGGPVRASGPRGAEALKDEGIAVRRIGSQTWPKWYERQNGSVTVKDDAPRPVKSSGNGNAPTFITKRRGK